MLIESCFAASQEGEVLLWWAGRMIQFIAHPGGGHVVAQVLRTHQMRVGLKRSSPGGQRFELSPLCRSSHLPFIMRLYELLASNPRVFFDAFLRDEVMTSLFRNCLKVGVRQEKNMNTRQQKAVATCLRYSANETMSSGVAVWTSWEIVSQCSRTCGSGFRSKRRFCVLPSGSRASDCEGNMFVSEKCSLPRCPLFDQSDEAGLDGDFSEPGSSFTGFSEFFVFWHNLNKR